MIICLAVVVGRPQSYYDKSRLSTSNVREERRGDTSKYDLNKLSAIIINTTEKMFKFLVIQFDIKINSVKAFWDITNGKRDN